MSVCAKSSPLNSKGMPASRAAAQVKQSPEPSAAPRRTGARPRRPSGRDRRRRPPPRRSLCRRAAGLAFRVRTLPSLDDDHHLGRRHRRQHGRVTLERVEESLASGSSRITAHSAEVSTAITRATRTRPPQRAMAASSRAAHVVAIGAPTGAPARPTSSDRSMKLGRASSSSSTRHRYRSEGRLG